MNPRFLVLSTISLSAHILSPEIVLGQETIVVSGTRTPRALKDLPVAVQVIRRDDIQKSGDTTAADAVSQAGLTTTPSFRGVGATIQGLSAAHVLVLVDGKRMGGKLAGTDDLERIPSEQIERIEVLKGASSVLYGSDAIGGVINIITKRPPLGVSGRSRITHSSNGREELSLGAGRGSETYRAGFFADHRRGEPFDLDTSDMDTTGSGFRKTRGGIDLDADLTGSFSLNSGVQVERLVTDGISTTAGGAVIDRETRTDVHSIMLEPKMSISKTEELRFELRGSRTVDVYEEDQRSDDALDKREDSTEWLREGALVYSNQVTATNEFVAGIDGLVQSMTSDRLDSGRGSRVRKSLMFQHEWRDSQSPRLYLVPGVRVDHDSQFGRKATKKIAVRYDLSTSVIVRASYGEGYRAPTFKETLLDYENQSVGYHISGNPDLRPEQSQSAQLGVARTISKHLWASLTLFDNQIRDLITTEVQSETAGKTTFTHVNAERVRTSGVETSVRVTSPVGIFAGLDHTLMRARDLSRDRDLGGRPKHAGSARLGYEDHDDEKGFTAVMSLTAVGPRQEYAMERGSEFSSRASAFRSLSLRLARHIGRSFELFVGGRNLTNEYDKTSNPVAPRNYYGGAAAVF